jgi:hypothetical protein
MTAGKLKAHKDFGQENKFTRFSDIFGSYTQTKICQASYQYKRQLGLKL